MASGEKGDDRGSCLGEWYRRCWPGELEREYGNRSADVLNVFNKLDQLCAGFIQQFDFLVCFLCKLFVPIKGLTPVPSGKHLCSKNPSSPAVCGICVQN